MTTYSKPKPQNFINMLPNTIIVDLDGTLADISHRRPLVQQAKPDWDLFYESCDKDTPNKWCVALIKVFKDFGYKVIILSARRESVRAKTQKWLKKVGIPNSVGCILLRKNDDHSEDTDLKRKWLHNYGKNKILFAVDDRQKVVDMWRAEGITCLQCDKWTEKDIFKIPCKCGKTSETCSHVFEALEKTMTGVVVEKNKKTS